MQENADKPERLQIPLPQPTVPPLLDPAQLAEDEEALRTTIQAGTAAQIVIAVAILLALCYVAKLPLIVICVSILIAFILAPLVFLLEKIKLPRPAAAIIALVLFCAVLYGLTYFFYQRALDFAREIPQYQHQIQRTIGKYRSDADQLQKTTESVMAATQTSPAARNAVPVTVKQESSGFSGWVRDNFGAVSELVLTITFIPFLTYFMLTWSEHIRRSTVKLFAAEHRRAAYRTLGKIAEMIRGFIVGNFYIALFLSVGSIAVFGFLGLPYFYFTGVLSGFLSVIPYLGVLFAILPPLATGMGVLNLEKVLIICGTILTLHLFAMNVLYPKILGKRLQLNPLVVTLSLLIWGWIWGAMGLILAVPIAGALKVLCDNVEQLKAVGEWMGE